MKTEEVRRIIDKHGWYTIFKVETKLGIYFATILDKEHIDEELSVEMLADEMSLDIPLENLVSLVPATQEEVDEYMRKYEEEQQEQSIDSSNDNLTDEEIDDYINQILNSSKEEPTQEQQEQQEELNEYLKKFEHNEERNSGYVTANAPYPCCNHTEDIGKENLGYVQGIMIDGTPFEAELWETEADGKNLSIVMADLPALYMEAYEDYLKYGMKEETAEERLASQPGHNTTHTDASVLTIGMIMEEDDLPTEITAAVTAYMEASGLVRFPGRCSNGAVRFFIDMNGNRVIQNIINLEGAFLEAETDLVFKPFVEKKEKGYETDGNVIRVKFGKV